MVELFPQSWRDLLAAVADAVEDFREAAHGVKNFGREEGEGIGEFHGGEVMRSGDAAALEQAEQIIVETELAREAQAFFAGERVEADARGAAP